MGKLPVIALIIFILLSMLPMILAIGEAGESNTVTFHKVPGAVEIYTLSAIGKLVYLSYKKSDGYYYLGIYDPGTDTVINESRVPESYSRIYYLNGYIYAIPTDTFSTLVRIYNGSLALVKGLYKYGQLWNTWYIDAEPLEDKFAVVLKADIYLVILIDGETLEYQEIPIRDFSISDIVFNGTHVLLRGFDIHNNPAILVYDKDFKSRLETITLSIPKIGNYDFQPNPVNVLRMGDKYVLLGGRSSDYSVIAILDNGQNLVKYYAIGMSVLRVTVVNDEYLAIIGERKGCRLQVSDYYINVLILLDTTTDKLYIYDINAYKHIDSGYYGPYLIRYGDYLLLPFSVPVSDVGFIMFKPQPPLPENEYLLQHDNNQCPIKVEKATQTHLSTGMAIAIGELLLIAVIGIILLKRSNGTSSAGIIVGAVVWLGFFALWMYISGLGVIPRWMLNNPVFMNSDLVFIIIASILTGALIALLLSMADPGFGLGFYIGTVIAPIIWFLILLLISNREKEGEKEEEE